jgi:hypothetical protein
MSRDDSSMAVRGKRLIKGTKQCSYCLSNGHTFPCPKCKRTGCWRCIPNGNAQPCPECATGKSVVDHV